MLSWNVYNIKGEKVRELELNSRVFGVEVNPYVVWEVIKMQLANRRKGTASTKTRAEVNFSNKKPWRQKGTGRARAGTRRSPIWRGGGTIFGPKPRDFSYRVPKKVRRLALKSLLSDKVNRERLLILDNLHIDPVKTKTFLDILNNFGLKEVLVVTPEKDEKILRVLRNIPKVDLLPVVGLNPYDIWVHDHLLLIEDAIPKIEERLLR